MKETRKVLIGHPGSAASSLLHCMHPSHRCCTCSMRSLDPSMLCGEVQVSNQQVASWPMSPTPPLRPVSIASHLQSGKTHIHRVLSCQSHGRYLPLELSSYSPFPSHQVPFQKPFFASRRRLSSPFSLVCIQVGLNNIRKLHSV